MKPKKLERSDTDDLFRARLQNIIDPRHPLVRLAHETDWGFFEAAIEPLYAEHGRPGVPVRFMVGLHILKHTFNLSDEEVCERWVENPYFQYFTGEEYFRHELPHDRSSMTRWRGRVSEEQLARLLQESPRIAHKTGALRIKDLRQATVDTTVQPKAITFPTDGKLLYRATLRLAKLARRWGVKLRQSYVRVGKLALMKSQRYAHARQFKRHRREVKFLRTRLGCVIRDIDRRTEGNASLQAAFRNELGLARRVRDQRRRQTGPKVYSLHAPEVECIGKGKPHKPYEFGLQGHRRHHQRTRSGRPVRHLHRRPAWQPVRRPHAQRHDRGRQSHHRPGARAHLRRQGLPRSRLRQAPPRVPLRPEARADAPHQAQLAAPLGRRTGDRPHEGGRTARAQLPQRPTRRPPQRHPRRRRPERPPPAQVVPASSFVPRSGLALRRPLTQAPPPRLSPSARRTRFSRTTP